MSFFNLAARATSRESQYFSKERRLPHTEYASHVQLIRSSEVDVFGSTAPGASSGASTKTLHSRAKTPSTAAPSANSAVIPRRRIFHQASTLASSPAATDEPLKASYRIAIANLKNELLAAKSEAQQARATLGLLKRKLKRMDRVGAMVVVASLGVVAYLAAGSEQRAQAVKAWQTMTGTIVERHEIPARAANGAGVGSEVAKSEYIQKDGRQTDYAVGLSGAERLPGWRRWLWAS